VTGTIAVADVVTGVTSGATGTVIARPDGQVVVTNVTGTFVNGEVLNVAAAPQGTITAPPAPGGAATALLDATYINLAADVYRALIAAVPGSGSVLGVVQFNDVVYAWRNNAGGTAAVIHKSTSTGWSAVTLHHEISFTAGGASQPAEGTTLTQGGVTAVIKRVVRTSGTFASNTAAGRLIITTPSGGNFAAGAATVGAINFTLSAAQTAITLLPDGAYEFVVSNFGGSTGTRRVYGVDGVNRGFEFDGDVLVPISTGMTADAPTRVEAHMQHLFFSFAGGSVQHAGPGTPYIWSVVLGAGEIAMGDHVTGMMTQPGSQTSGALAIYTRNRTSILYGTGVTDWLLIPYRHELGGYARSFQDVGRTLFLDDLGVTDFRTAQEFGNFSHEAISADVRPKLNELRPTFTASCVSRELSQYRLFFSSGVAYYFTFSKNKFVGAMPMFFTNPVRCVWSGEQNDGTEAIFFGSDDGFVYQMEKGTSFDGDPIEYYFNLPYNNNGSPRVIKHYRHAMLEVAGSSYAEFSFGYSLGYGVAGIDQPAPQSLVAPFAAARWDAFTWDAFVWDGHTLLPAEIDMGGDSENCSVSVQGNSDICGPFTITGTIIHYTPRRALR